jgi:putative phosphoesterase
MKIIATSDIHYDLIYTVDNLIHMSKFISNLEQEKSDILIIAGDTVGLGWAKLNECLRMFSTVAPVRLMVLGNHDYWSADKMTFKHLEHLEKIISSHGFHLLDKGPKVIKKVGFAGNCGWYDYSFASASTLPKGTSYQNKTFDGEIYWNDVNFVDLGKTDGDYTSQLVDQLEKDIEFLEKKVETIVAVTHHIGFEEMVIRKDTNPAWSFGNAFMGSKLIGEMLLKHPKVKYHICGHIHARSEVKKGSLVSINPGSDYQIKRFSTLELS